VRLGHAARHGVSCLDHEHVKLEVAAKLVSFCLNTSNEKPKHCGNLQHTLSCPSLSLQFNSLELVAAIGLPKIGIRSRPRN
jgi:hypothetical protein